MWIKAFWGAPWSKGMLLSSEKDLRWLILLAITSPLGTIPILRQHIFGDILTHPPTIELFIPFSFFVLAYEVMKILHNSLLYQFSYFKIFVLPCKMQKWNTLKWKYYNLFLAKNKVIEICYEPDICQHEYGTEGLQKLTFFFETANLPTQSYCWRNIWMVPNRRADGSLITTAVSPYPAVIYKNATANR